MTSSRKPKQVLTPELYQSYSTEEDAQRSAFHYEQPIKFFYPILGGEWNVYSCNLWPESADTDTEAQEAKLDLLAQLMELKPGQRVLDVGCGWGGPLVYLCKTYGVHGVGITVSPSQKHGAEERIAKYEVDAQIIECHWRDFQDDRGFDVIYSDEVIVHFNDLAGFFVKSHSLLHDGGRMVHKELHFTHPSYSPMTRGMSFVNDIFASTGNYRTLAEELTLLGEAGFEVQRIHQIPLTHYHKTLDRWMSNMWQHREELKALVGTDTYQRYRSYFRVVYRLFTTKMMTLDVVVSHKMSNFKEASSYHSAL